MPKSRARNFYEVFNVLHAVAGQKATDVAKIVNKNANGQKDKTISPGTISRWRREKFIRGTHEKMDLVLNTVGVTYGYIVMGEKNNIDDVLKKAKRANGK